MTLDVLPLIVVFITLAATVVVFCVAGGVLGMHVYRLRREPPPSASEPRGAAFDRGKLSDGMDDLFSRLVEPPPEWWPETLHLFWETRVLELVRDGSGLKAAFADKGVGDEEYWGDVVPRYFRWREETAVFLVEIDRQAALLACQYVVEDVYPAIVGTAEDLSGAAGLVPEEDLPEALAFCARCQDDIMSGDVDRLVRGLLIWGMIKESLERQEEDDGPEEPPDPGRILH